MGQHSSGKHRSPKGAQGKRAGTPAPGNPGYGGHGQRYTAGAKPGCFGAAVLLVLALSSVGAVTGFAVSLALRAAVG